MKESSKLKRLDLLKRLITNETGKLKFRLKMIYYLDDGIIEDAVGKGLEKLWTLRRNLLDKDDASAAIRYITVVARNEILDWLRRDKKESPTEDQQLGRMKQEATEDRYGEAPDNLPQNTELFKKIEMAMQQLTPRQRELVQYKIYDQMKYSDIAIKMGVSKGTVKASYSQVIKKLKKIIGPVE